MANCGFVPRFLVISKKAVVRDFLTVVSQGGRKNPPGRKLLAPGS